MSEQNPSPKFTIGYALAPKKESSFVQTSLIDHARQKSIDLVPIDLQRPLVEQGPFDCVIHKLYGQDWKDQLQEFNSLYPGTPVIDSPEAIEQLHNRISMLEFVRELRVPEKTETYGVPKQIVVYNAEGLEGMEKSLEGNLNFPVIAKPLVADGSAKSHKMSLIFNQDGLKKLKPPIVLQEFVNHGGVIFKVYVVGDYVKCVKRKSLPDVSEEKLKTLEGSMSFSQVSNLTANHKNNHEDDGFLDVSVFEDVDMPPLSFITDIAVGLRKAMGLNLFNFDVIRDVKVGNRYLVIDINYFPGYAKMPNYEPVLTDFFWDIVHKNQKVGLGKGDNEKIADKEGEKVAGDAFCGDGGVGV